MGDSERRSLISGIRVTSIGTLISRVLGMLRDVATAALLGISGSPVMDAFVVAFRVPNLFRRMFGEGALTASYLPVFTEQLSRDRQAAWRLATVTLVWVCLALTALVVFGELLLAGMWFAWRDEASVALLIKLSAILLPYCVLICAAAQIAATLHALSEFRAPALTPIVLNLCWLVAALWIAPAFEGKSTQAFVLATTVLAAGVVQVAVLLPALRSLGFQFDYNWQASRAAFGRVVSAMGPMMLGLAITQINTLLDSLLAWGLAAPANHEGGVAWLGGAVDYPLTQGAASAVYLGERMYQFPVGILGLAVATVIFPLLSRHAARGDRTPLAGDLSLGLRLVIALATPAGVGMVMLATPITRALFEYGEFTSQDTLRTAAMIAAYGWGVWAYCALPVVVRGFYAVGDRTTPVKIGAAMVLLNLTLNLSLVWPLGETGLAFSTAICAGVQIVVLLGLFSRSAAAIHWRPVLVSLLRTAVATAVMAVAISLTMSRVGDAGRWTALIAPMFVGFAAYTIVAWVIGGEELRLLFGRIRRR